MSYGLSVYLATALSAEELKSLAAEVRGLSLVEVEMPAGRYYQLQRAMKSGPADLASFSGPLRTESEDLPGEVRAAVPPVEWLYEFDAPLSPAKNLALLQRYATAMARRGSGVVYDPQEDGITWPAGQGRAPAREEEVEIDSIDLGWSVRREDIPAGLGGALFDLIAERLPCALPRRFGVGEPYPWSLKKDGREGFVRAWDSEDMGIRWLGTPPCLYGDIMNLGAKWSLSPPERAKGSLTIKLDARAFVEARQRDAAAAFFRAVTERSRAFFAAARITRRVLLRNGKAWHTGRTLSPIRLGTDEGWGGLPPEPCWLLGFGPPYRGLVAEGAARLGQVEEFPGGLIVRNDEVLRNLEGASEPVAPDPRPPSLLDRLIGRWKRGASPRGLAHEYPRLVVRPGPAMSNGPSLRAEIVPPEL